MDQSVVPVAISASRSAWAGPSGRWNRVMLLRETAWQWAVALQPQRLIERKRRRHIVAVALQAGRQRNAVLDRLPPPWPRKGSIGWHASPSRVTRPNDQRESGSRSSSAHLKV